MGYSKRQLKDAIKQAVNDTLLNGQRPVLHPTAHLLGGQSGSGKSTIHKILLEQDPNTIVIDGDRFREYHPSFAEIQQKYGKDAANYTQEFSNSIVNALIEKFSSEHYNLIIEGTCRTAEVPLNTCKQLKAKGYNVNLAVMCTDKETAWQSTIDRYNAMKDRGLSPRAVPREKYDLTVQVLPINISKLYKSGQFDDILLFNRNRECLYRFKEQPGRDPAEIVDLELNGQRVFKRSKPVKPLSQKIDEAKKKSHERNAAAPFRTKPPNKKHHKL